MRVARMALLVLPLTLIAAVCVTDLRQRGDTGPWTGEITNYGPDTVAWMYVDGVVVDATGSEIAYVQGTPCPSVLRPGETAAFSMAIDPATLGASVQLGGLKTPLKLRNGPQAWSQPVPDDQLQYTYTTRGLSVEIKRTNASEGYILGDIANDSAFHMQQVIACAVVRGADGHVLSVGTGRAVPNIMRTGDTDTIPLFFPAGIPAGDIEIVAEGMPNGCCQLTVDPAGVMTVSMTRIVDEPTGRYLRVVGELHNTTNVDLSGYSLTAHLDDRWEERVDGASLGCDGPLARGDSVAFDLAFPVASNRTDREITIEGIEAYESAALVKLDVASIAVAPPHPSPWGGALPLRSVSYTVRNQSAEWVQTYAVCAALRDRAGRVVGANSSGTGGQYLAPGATLSFTLDVEELSPPASATVIAYALPQFGPPPPLPSPISVH